MINIEDSNFFAACINVRRRDNGIIEVQRFFFIQEYLTPNLVKNFREQYDDSAWHTELIVLIVSSELGNYDS